MKTNVRKIRKIRRYSIEFKKSLVSLFEKGEYSVIQLEKLYGVGNSMIYDWIYKYSDFNEKGVRIVHMMESQMNYIMDYIAKLEKSDKKISINIKKQTQDKYNEKIQSQFKGTVWASGCKSWYLDSNGRNTTLYPQLTTKFREELKKVDWEDYELNVL